MSRVLMRLAVIFLFLSGCSQQNNANSIAALEGRIASLEKAIDDLKPGLGEVMGVIQQHHAKLCYAGTKANWPLADYELSEIQESLDDAMKFYPKFEGVAVPLTQLILTRMKSVCLDGRVYINRYARNGAPSPDKSDSRKLGLNHLLSARP